jgi:hypothetical protein
MCVTVTQSDRMPLCSAPLNDEIEADINADLATDQSGGGIDH